MKINLEQVICRLILQVLALDGGVKNNLKDHARAYTFYSDSTVKF